MSADTLLAWLYDNIIPACVLAVMFWLANTATKISDRTLSLETDLKLAVHTFTEQAKQTNHHIERMLKEMDKLDEHHEKIIRIEEREKHNADKLTYITRWREEHEKLHASNS